MEHNSKEFQYHVTEAILCRRLGHKCLFISHLKSIEHYLIYDYHSRVKWPVGPWDEE